MKDTRYIEMALHKIDDNIEQLMAELQLVNQKIDEKLKEEAK